MSVPKTSLRTTGVGVLAAVFALAVAGCSSSVSSASEGEEGAVALAQSEPSDDAPQSVVEDEPSEDLSTAAGIAESMTLEQKAAAVLMVHFPGADPASFEGWTRALQPAGIILMGDNTALGAQSAAELVGAAQAESTWPLLVGIDQEGGVVSRLSDDPAAGPEQLREMTANEVEEQQATRARFLRELGINTNFGIVADVADEPGSFIWQRVLGTTASVAAQNVRASVIGENEGGVYSTLKHFPGHGAAPGDSHQVIPEKTIEFDEWEREVGLPFQAGIDAGAELVMMGHLLFRPVGSSPATLSSEWVQVLREDMGFDGVIITDDMRMLTDSGLPEYANGAENAVRALEAGVDLILYVFPAGSDPVTASQTLIDAVVAATVEGRIPEAQLTKSVERVMGIRLPVG